MKRASCRTGSSIGLTGRVGQPDPNRLFLSGGARLALQSQKQKGRPFEAALGETQIRSRSGLRFFFAWFFGGRRRSGLLIAGHAFLETAYAFTQSAHKLRDLAAAKKNQHDDQNDEPVHWEFHTASCP